MLITDTLLDITDALSARRAAYLKAHKLTAGQFRIAQYLFEYGPAATGAVGTATRVAPSTMTNVADTMVKSGWLERVHEPADRRVILLKVADDKQELLTQLIAEIRDMETPVAETLQPAHTLLTKLANDM